MHVRTFKNVKKAWFGTHFYQLSLNFWSIYLVTLLLLASLSGAVAAKTFYVAPEGNDQWSGTVEQVNATSTNGPFASLLGAKAAVRRFKLTSPKEAITIQVADGIYTLKRPVVFTAEDSGSKDFPIRYVAAPNARPVFEGGIPLTGFQLTKDGLWVTQLPQAKAGSWYFEQLFVNGQRATRARTPNFYLRSEVDQRQTFRAYAQDIAAVKGLSEAELRDVVVVLYHSWEASRHHITKVDAVANTVTLTEEATYPPAGGLPQRYYLENYRAALDTPGEWFLGRDGQLFYKPRPGEDIRSAKVIAPVTDQFIVLAGNPVEGGWVEYITFKGLRFHYSQFTLPANSVNSPQAASAIPATIMVDGARWITLEGCEIAHAGIYGIWFRRGNRYNRVIGSYLHDLGAGGVRIGEGLIQGSPNERTHHITVANTIIQSGGLIFPGAVGIWVGHSGDNQIIHNTIADFRYTGISVGWSWGYGASLAQRNHIDYNHIHHIGQGVLSDLGGIYTLGRSPGTTINNNLIHDVYAYNQYGRGGWGIYNDEGTSNIEVKNNLVYKTSNGGYHLHYGADNSVRNNIFALGEDFQLQRSRVENYQALDFSNNIIYWEKSNLFYGTWSDGSITLDRNLYFRGDGQPITWEGKDFAAWKRNGEDQHSRVADPQFYNPQRFDFRLKPTSPAFALGFKAFDSTQAGVYKNHPWLPLVSKLQFPERPVVPKPLLIPLFGVRDGFESLVPGSPPLDGLRVIENNGDTIEVSAETASEGRQSLKFVDAPGSKFAFIPYLYYTPGYKAGRVQVAFDLRVEEGAVMYHEWRDNQQPYRRGPGFRIEGGKLLIAGNPVLDMPSAQWVRFEITASLGAQARTWTLKVTRPGQAPYIATIKNLDPTWQHLDWLGFVSDATTKTIFYMDNVTIQNLQPN
jgi:hypothetical protein